MTVCVCMDTRWIWQPFLLVEHVTTRRWPTTSTGEWVSG